VPARDGGKFVPIPKPNGWPARDPRAA